MKQGKLFKGLISQPPHFLLASDHSIHVYSTVLGPNLSSTSGFQCFETRPAQVNRVDCRKLESRKQRVRCPFYYLLLLRKLRRRQAGASNLHDSNTVKTMRAQKKRKRVLKTKAFVAFLSSAIVHVTRLGHGVSSFRVHGQAGQAIYCIYSTASRVDQPPRFHPHQPLHFAASTVGERGLARR